MRKRYAWTWGGGGFLLGLALGFAGCALLGLPVPAGTLPGLWAVASVWVMGCVVAALWRMGSAR